MEHLNPVRQIHRPTHLVILGAGDLLVILSFVWIGRSSHSLSVADVVAGLTTALPFIIGWFLITPWFGLYRSEIRQSWRKWVPRFLAAWAIAGPLSLVLRALFLGRPLSSSIIPGFATIALGYIGFVVLAWRLGYIWWVRHRTAAKEVEA
jgi:hypothetical protein